MYFSGNFLSQGRKNEKWKGGEEEERRRGKEEKRKGKEAKNEEEEKKGNWYFLKEERHLRTEVLDYFLQNSCQLAYCCLPFGKTEIVLCETCAL